MNAVMDDISFEKVRSLINRYAGIELNASKRLMALNRLSKPMRSLGLSALPEYLARVESDQALRQTFINAMTTHVTSFFREPHHYPLLVAALAKAPATPHLWSAGCSTGEEPYSILISLIEAFPGRFEKTAAPLILATDIDSHVVQLARKGIYARSALAGIGEARLGQCFDRLDAQHFQVKPWLRRLVEFRQHNLADASARLHWPAFDAIFCRNVMIYFGSEVQRDITRRFHQDLKPEGLLFAGHAEMLMHSDDLFRSLGQTLYRRRPGA